MNKQIKVIELGRYKEEDFSSRRAMAREIEKDVVRVMENEQTTRGFTKAHLSYKQ